MASSGGNFKLTVCFETIRIVVPCGNGELLVKDLTELAVSRYRKAIGKGSDYRVIIHNLRSFGGGILDQDDRLIDVVDDRDQIIATFEEQDGRHSRHPGADGKSVSSAGTSSPDLFYVQNALCSGRTTETLGPPLNTELVSLKSESVPSQIDKVDNAQDDTICSMKAFDRIGSKDLVPKSYGLPDGAFRTFGRSSSRKSLCGSNTMLAWLDAQDKLLDKQEQEDKRKDPVGSSDWAEIGDQRTSGTVVGSKFFPSVISESWGKVVLENDGSALGIHVVPGIDENERSMGLLIQGIDPSGRVFGDGRLRVDDCIVEVNGVSLIDRDFNEAQEIFKEALQAPMMNLRIAFNDDAPPLPSHSLVFKPNMCRKPLPELPLDSDVPNTSTPSKELAEDEPTPLKSLENCLHVKESPSTPAKRVPSTVAKRAPSTITKQAPSTATKQAPSTVTKQTPSAYQRQTTQSDIKVFTTSKPTHSSCTNLAPSSEVKRLPSSAVKQHMTPSLVGRGGPSQTLLSSAHKGMHTPLHGTKAVRKKLHVQLVKGSQGLGFSITTRDNTTEDGDWPVYIKHILPQGAAITDGRLRPGDRLLEVNGIKMSNKTQNEAVNYLRNIRIGSVVNLVLSRQEVNDSELPSKSDENHNIPGVSDTDMFLFIIVLRENGTESGLGISVKGKTVAGDDVDLGLFVKSVMVGGAAAKDGRLKEDDRLIEVNGHSLVGLANSDAMELLRCAMETDGPEPGTISLVIAREKFAPLIQNDETESISNIYERLNGKALSSKKLTHGENGEKRASEKESGNGGRNCPLPTWKSNRNISYHQATHESTIVESTVNVSEKSCQDGISTRLNSCNNESGKNQPNDTNQVCSEAKTRYDLLPVSCAATPSHSSNPVLRRTVSVLHDCAPTPPEWLPEWNKANHDVTYMSSNASPMEVDAMKAFSRDAIGRQSMSEKRKGHVDPRTSSFYQQIKIAKAQNDTQSTLKKAVSMESLLSQSNLATPKATARSCRTRESLKRYNSVENLKASERGPNDTVVHRGTVPNDSFKAAMNTSFKKLVTDNMETVNEEVDAEPADDVEKKKSKNPFKGLFRFGKAKKEEKTKRTESGKEQNKQQPSTENYDKPPSREVTRGGTLQEQVVRTEQERQKRLSVVQSNNVEDCRSKESMRRENNSTKEETVKRLYRSCHKNQISDDHMNSCDYQQSDYGSFGGSTHHLDGPYNRSRGHPCGGCTGNDVGGYYVNCRDLQTPHNPYDSCQDPYRCCGVAQTPNPHLQCCSVPARADPTFYQDAFHPGGFHPSMMPNEPCDRRSRCLAYGGHGPPHVIAQTPQHRVPGGNPYPIHHPTTPMMNVHKAMPSVVVPPHVGDDLYCQDQCCTTTYAAPRHQYQHIVDPRYTGTMSRKYFNPSAQRFDPQKV